MTCRRPAILALSSILFAGCAAQPPATPAPRPVSSALTNTDPCAMRLHEVCGALLLYYNDHHDLPPSLNALKKAPGAEDVGDLTCPASHKPYVYVPAGLPVAPPPSRVVLYDPEPAHAGLRLAVVIQPPQDAAAPLIAKVIAIPEAKVKSMLATTRP